MSIHDDIQEIIPSYVLGASEPDEAARAEAHLSTCDRCSRVLAEYQPIATAIAMTVPILHPPGDLKARTMRRALGERTTTNVSLWDRIKLWRPGTLFAPALAGAAIVIALFAIGLNIWQSAQLSRQVQVQRDLMTVVAYAQGSAKIVRGTDKAPEAVGRLYLDFDSSVAALVTVNMPVLAEERVYQVWLTGPDGAKTSGGILKLDSEGNGWMLVRAPHRLSEYVQVGVSEEPAGGSLAPTNKPVLLASLTTQ